jgi:hypothetical protein
MEASEMTICIFCSNPANSKEDMFPRWVHRSVKTRELLSRRIGDAMPIITEDQEVRIPCVCQTCNNEWMSRLEMKCKPIAGSLLEDLSLALDAEQRKFLTEWALKTAMINDTCGGRPRFFTEDECHAFKTNNRAIPDATTVWAGRFTGRTLSAIGSAFRLDSPTVQGIVTAHAFTLCVGHLILQVLSLHMKPGITKVSLTDTPIMWNEFLISVWPPPKEQRITWPPKYNFGLVENVKLGNLHYGRLLERWKEGHGYTITGPQIQQT